MLTGQLFNTPVSITEDIDLQYSLDFSTDFVVGLRDGMIHVLSTLSINQYDVLATAGDNGVPRRFSR